MLERASRRALAPIIVNMFETVCEKSIERFKLGTRNTFPTETAEKKKKKSNSKDRKRSKSDALAEVKKRARSYATFKFPPFFISLSSAAFSYFTYDVAFNTIQNTPPPILTDRTHSPYPHPTGNPLSANPPVSRVRIVSNLFAMSQL